MNNKEFYKIPHPGGRPKVLTPDQLRQKANEYFSWCIENPLKEEEVVKYKEYFEIAEVSKPRVFTIQGLCMFIGIGSSTFYDYEGRPEFAEIISRIRNVIYHQKFEGAAAGFFKENLIIRDLKLKETTEVEHRNTPRELTRNEILALEESIQDRYGKLPEPVTIDIEFDEVDDESSESRM